jgi:HAD superfamily hydrolase (TIGR01509 family)
MPELKAVVFDLGGTLCEWYDGLVPEVMLASAAPAAIALLPPAQAAGLTAAAVGRAVRQAYVAVEEASCEGDRSPVPAEMVVQRALQSFDLAVDSDTARAFLAALYIPESRTTRLLPGAAETLHTLVGQGLRLGIISNRMHGGTLLLDDLGYFGISHYFSSVIASCDVGYMKPHPALFLRSLEELGVEPGEAVMVGDDLRADIGGALAVGMRAVWMRRPPTRTDDPPAGVPSMTRLAELPPILARLD